MKHSPDRVRSVSALAVLLLGISVFYGATVRQGNSWDGDDYALYIHHAENIVEGRPYADTGYVYNRDVPDYSPRAYPPVFPLLLAPIYRIYGLNFRAMKMEEVIFFLFFLLTVIAYSEQDLDWPYLLALVGLLGFNPHFWQSKDFVGSDLLFLLLFYLTALVVARSPREGPLWWRWAVAAGMLLYLCIGTRTIGITLCAGLVLYDFVKYRKLSRFAVTAIMVCLLFLLAQRQLIGAGEQSYLDQLHPTLKSILANCLAYLRVFMTLWGRSLGRGASIVLFAVTAVAACIGGYLYRAKGLTTVEAFLLPYLLAVILWPSRQGLRFLFPLIPFYVFLVLIGLQRLARFSPAVWARATVAVPLLVIGLSYALFFSHANYGAIRETDGQPSFNDLSKFIQANTAPNDVLMFRNGRALSLFTSRPAIVYDPTHQDRVEGELVRLHVTYIVSTPIFDEDRKVLIPFVQSYLPHLDEVYENSDFQVYRIREHTTSPTVSPPRGIHCRCAPNGHPDVYIGSHSLPPATKSVIVLGCRHPEVSRPRYGRFLQVLFLPDSRSQLTLE